MLKDIIASLAGKGLGQAGVPSILADPVTNYLRTHFPSTSVEVMSKAIAQSKTPWPFVLAALITKVARRTFEGSADLPVLTQQQIITALEAWCATPELAHIRLLPDQERVYHEPVPAAAQIAGFVRVVGISDDVEDALATELCAQISESVLGALMDLLEPHEAALAQRLRASQYICVPSRSHRLGSSNPAALLRAEYSLVPFHLRSEELSNFLTWSNDTSQPLALRLYTGQGGTGKTRLLMEACLRLGRLGWFAGFVPRGMDLRGALPDDVPCLLVIDYAETREEEVEQALEFILKRRGQPSRLVLLARRKATWWTRVTRQDLASEFLLGPSSHAISLAPIATSFADREVSFGLATTAFASALDVPKPVVQPDTVDLSDPVFDHALMLHMAALLVTTKELPECSGSMLLGAVLARERRYWARLAEDLPGSLREHVDVAMAMITLAQGVDAASSETLLRRHPIFADQSTADLMALLSLLHTCYPGEHWIEPLRPDILGEHLFSEVVAHNPMAEMALISAMGWSGA